jgi:hypothetical protein
MLEAKDLNAKLVFDLVYNPLETPLIRCAAEGIPIITGIEMFVQQGARQFEIWTGKPAPEEEMLRVCCTRCVSRPRLRRLRKKPRAKAFEKTKSGDEKVAACPAGEAEALAKGLRCLLGFQGAISEKKKPGECR